MSTNIVSLEATLRGKIDSFLEKLNMECRKTTKMLTELAFSLSHYTEEGVNLHPKVLILDDKNDAVHLMQCRSMIRIDSTEMSKGGIRQALKKCAPLARSGWTIYVERQHSAPNDMIEFGVCREPGATALDLRESLASSTVEEIHAILAFQAAPKIVELMGPGGHRVYAHLSGVSEEDPYEVDEVDRLASMCCQDIGARLPPQIHNSARSFMRTALFNAIREGHGCLVAVVETVPEKLKSDASILDESIDLATHIEQYVQDGSAEAADALRSFQTLLSGMLGSDGITLLGSNCRIIGYRSFVHVATTDKPSASLGGARRRAFKVLQDLLASGDIVGAFFRSSDGQVILKGNTDV